MLNLISYLLIALGALLCAVEDLVTLPRIRLVLRLGKARVVLTFIISAVLALCGVLVFIAVFILQSPQNVILLTVFGVLAVGLLLRSFVIQTLDGSDRMLVIAAAGIFVFATFKGYSDPLALFSWIGLTVILGWAYFESGLSKVKQKGWRTGRQFALILNMKEFGNRSAAQILLSNPKLSMVASWGVILIELSAGPLLFCGGPIAATTAVFLSLMHGSIALLMGLSRFFYPFVGALCFVIANHPW